MAEHDVDKISQAMAAVDKGITEASRFPTTPARFAGAAQEAVRVVGANHEPRSLSQWLRQFDGRLDKLEQRLARLERWLGAES